MLRAMGMERSAQEVLTAWQCIGCGRLDSPQPCIGVCRDRKVRLVRTEEHERALAALDAAQARLDAIRGVLRRFESATPRDACWERSYRALLDAARVALGD